MPSRRSLATICLALALTPLAALAQEEDKPGSKDHPLISRYPGSVIQDYEQKEFDEFVVPLGPAKDYNELGRSQKLEGRVTKIFYNFPENRSTLEVFRNYEQALAKAGFTTLFSCSGVEGPKSCGQVQFLYHNWFAAGSNYEDQQRTLTARLQRPEGDVYVTLHVCPMWAFLGVVETKPMESGLVTANAAALAGDLKRTGHVAVYGIYFDAGKADLKPESDPALAEIATLLKQNPLLKLHVVGHTDSTGDLAANLDLSRRRAQAVVAALTTRYGIAAARLRADGVGPLAPVASNETEEGRAKNRRVELVKQ